VLAEAEGFLRLLEASQRRLLAGALGSSLRLPAERLVWVLDSVLVAVALDLGDAAIPGLLLRRIARSLAKLAPDVGGWVETGGEDRHLAALGQHGVGDRQLAAGGIADLGHPGQLGFVAGEMLVEDSLVHLDPAQGLASLGVQNGLGPVLGFQSRAAIEQFLDAVFEPSAWLRTYPCRPAATRAA
jgi:hypothetical protein